MEISAINSLAEVGVGVNLAFGMIKGIRERVGEYFKEDLNLFVMKIQATLNEVLSSDIEQSQIALGVSDIAQNFDEREDMATNLLAVLAILVSLADVWILYESAMNPSRDLPSWFAALAVGLAIGPIVFSLLVNGCVYFFARRRLLKKLNEYNSFATLARQMKVNITPAAPTEK